MADWTPPIGFVFKSTLSMARLLTIFVTENTQYLYNWLTSVDAAYQAADADIISDYQAADADIIGDYQAADTALSGSISSLSSTVSALEAETTQAPVLDTSSSDLTLTTSFQDVPGAAITAPKNGVYLVIAVFYFVGIGSGDNDHLAQGTISINGSDNSRYAVFGLRDDSSIQSKATVTQLYVVSLAAGDTVKLRARKDTGTGSSVCRQTHSSLIIDTHVG